MFSGEELWFSRAQFYGEARFERAQFGRIAMFDGVEFSEGANFDEAQFSNVWFEHAQFSRNAAFERARFNGLTLFDGAQFCDDALFDAEFGGPVLFDNVHFYGTASFGGAKFHQDAGFEGVKFRQAAGFEGAEFRGGTRLKDALFSAGAQFNGARFKHEVVLGPLTVGNLSLAGAVFEHPVGMEVTAVRMSCVGTSWRGGVTMRLNDARVSLQRARFAALSSVAGMYPVSAGSVLSAPKLTSLQEVNTANLAVTDVDLSLCYFVGAQRLDQIRLQGHCKFDSPPRGLRFGLAWPPVWWWSNRQTLAEERTWRATTRKYSGWFAASDTGSVPGGGPAASGIEAAVRAGTVTGTTESRSVGFPIEDAEDARSRLGGPQRDRRRLSTEGLGERLVPPELLVGLYRQLRKAQEDAKNEPGAADFYYGEMEMRRHAPTTPWPERLIVTAYWAISGYGLRATRALITLALLILASAALLRYTGFSGKAPSYVHSLLYAGGSVLSLDLAVRNLPHVLTAWGAVIRIMLRIAGPVCLALAALALRGRVKR